MAASRRLATKPLSRFDGVGRIAQVAADAPTPNQDFTPAVQTQSSYDDPRSREPTMKSINPATEEVIETHEEHDEATVDARCGRRRGDRFAGHRPRVQPL